MALVVGLDIGTRSLTGAVLAGTANKFRLVDFFVEEIPSLEAPVAPAPATDTTAEYVPPPSIEELIQKTLEEKHLKGVDVVASVESRDCVLRQFQVPFTKDEQIRKVVHYTAEEHFPAFSMDEVVLEYMKVGESNEKSQLIVAALRNEIIESRLAVLKRAGVDPVALDLDCAALFNAFALTPHYDPEKSVLVVDLGATSTKIVHVEAGELRKIRSFRTAAAVAGPERMIAQPVGAGAGAEAAGGGPRTLADTILPGRSIEDRFREIETLLRQFEKGASGGEEHGDAPIAILSDEEFSRVSEAASGASPGHPHPSAEAAGGAPRPSAGGGEIDYQGYLERVCAEIQRTFAVSRARIDVVCLTGGLSDGDEARRFVASELGVDAVHLDFEKVLPMDVEPRRVLDVNRQGAVAIGLAAKEFGKDRVGLDFRKGRFRYEHRFSRLKFPLLLLSIFAFLFFLQTAFWAYHEHQRFSLLAAGIEGEMQAVYKEFFGKEVAAGRDPLQAAEAQKKAWQGKGIGGMDKVVEAVPAIRNAAEVLALTGLQYRIKTMKFEFVVRPRLGTVGKKAVLTGQDSQIELTAQENDAHLTIEKKFREPASRFFIAQTSSRMGKEGNQVTVKLTLKPSVLQQLE